MLSARTIGLFLAGAVAWLVRKHWIGPGKDDWHGPRSVCHVRDGDLCINWVNYPPPEPQASGNPGPPRSVCHEWDAGGECAGWSNYNSRYLRNGADADLENYAASCIQRGRAVEMRGSSDGARSFGCIESCPNGAVMCVRENEGRS